MRNLRSSKRKPKDQRDIESVGIIFCTTCQLYSTQNIKDEIELKKNFYLDC